MYVAMNRFKVIKGSEQAFEDVWKNRNSSLSEMTGFREFHLLRGPLNEAEGYTLFASHTIWESERDFIAWTKSENFRAAHRNAGGNKPLYLGHPVFEGFTSVDECGLSRDSPDRRDPACRLRSRQQAGIAAGRRRVDADRALMRIGGRIENLGDQRHDRTGSLGEHLAHDAHRFGGA